MITIRIRSLMWFTTGIVLSMTMLASSTAWRAEALPGPGESTIVTVEPSRVLDTRDPVNVGLAGPFVSATSQKLTVTGMVPTTTGSKVVVPAGATGVLLNVTAINPTAAGFVSIRPGDAVGAPSTSSLNVSAGQTVPNSVQVGLPTSGANAGQIDITYDAFGTPGPTTDLLIDVVGYTTSAGLQDLVSNLPIASSAREDNVGELGDFTSYSIGVSATITVPVAGVLQVNGGTLIDSPVPAGEYNCRLTIGAGNTVNGSGFEDTDRAVTLTTPNEESFCQTSGAVGVTAGTHTINLALRTPTATNAFDDATLDVLFVAGSSTVASMRSADEPDSDD